MYAVIRAGGKQYRVAPGDVIRVEKLATGTDGLVEFPEMLAVSGGDGQIGKPKSEARVVGQLVEEGRGAKISGFPLQAEEAVQETARTSAGLHGGAHHGDCFRRAELQGSGIAEEGTQGEEGSGARGRTRARRRGC